MRRERKPLWDRFVGALAILTLMLPWTYGLMLYPLTMYLLYHGHVIIGTLLVTVIAYPYFAKDKRWDAWTDFLLRGADYFDEHSFEVTETFGVDRPYIAAYHPHGIISQGFIYNAGLRKDFTGVRGMGAPIIKHIPLLNLVFKWTGATTSSAKKNVLRIMKERKSLGVIPGGFEEATITCKDKDRVYIKDRKGFIKYALQFGYDVVPAYTFGDTGAYDNLQGWWPTRLALNKHHVPTVLPFGAWFFPLLPKYTAGVHTVIGRPIRCPRIENPTEKDVNYYHAQYIEALQELYDKHKGDFGMEDRTLEIW